MKILAFSDWRVQPLEMIIDIVTTHKPDMILYAGDDLDRVVGINGSLVLKTSNHFIELSYPNLEPVLNTQKEIFRALFKEQLEQFLQEKTEFNRRCQIECKFDRKSILSKINVPFYYVDGNDDSILNVENRYYSRIQRITFSESRFNGKIKKQTIDDWNSNRGIYIPINPSFGDFKFQNKNEKIKIFGWECESNEIKNNPEYADIYLSHLPPLGTLDLSTRGGLRHTGSKKLLDVINKYQPKLVICGHSHMWGGQYGKIGETIIINVSSHDNRFSPPGNYALIDTENWSVEMKTIEHKIPFVRGLTTLKSNLNKKRWENSSNEFYEMCTSLGDWSRHGPQSPEECSEILKNIEKFGVDTKKVKERIDTLTNEKPKINGKITINPSKDAFIDVETGLANGQEPGKLWLIGLWYNNNFRHFIFPKEKKEFLDYIKQNQIKSLVSWTGYDRKVLQPILKKARITVRFIDACQRTSNCVVWHTYRLHELYDALFPDEKNEENLIPGHLAGLYADHLIIPNKSCPYCPPKDKIIDQIKNRNRVDILQMIEICIKLRNG
ncbi:MAG: metallophosphoesterase [Candidatus Methanoperedens sp.]|nr:metallophosphoesterase [Candidatus Methanoperedens sp.]MCZ7404336.1 metallophosphoesterase [Candidatus Methanoperedens sp.]